MRGEKRWGGEGWRLGGAMQCTFSSRWLRKQTHASALCGPAMACSAAASAPAQARMLQRADPAVLPPRWPGRLCRWWAFEFLLIMAGWFRDAQLAVATMGVLQLSSSIA